jgi:hypothetical protein
MRCVVCRGVRESALALAENEYVCHSHAVAGSLVIESPSEQAWADFCSTLERPAFLLPITGFGDLEQS